MKKIGSRVTYEGKNLTAAIPACATVDQPQRFVHSRAVGAHVGLTSKRYQSGEVDYDGRVSKCGDALLRTMLLHRMWVDDSEFRWSKDSAAVPAVA